MPANARRKPRRSSRLSNSPYSIRPPPGEAVARHVDARLRRPLIRGPRIEMVRIGITGNFPIVPAASAIRTSPRRRRYEPPSPRPSAVRSRQVLAVSSTYGRSDLGARGGIGTIAARPSGGYAATASSCWRLSSSSSMAPTAMFSSRCDTDEVPGISSTLGATLNVHADATCAGVWPSRSAAPHQRRGRTPDFGAVTPPPAGRTARKRCRVRCIPPAPASTTGRRG